MSVFLVEDRTINRVVTFVRYLLEREWSDLEREFLYIGFDRSDPLFGRKLGQAMFDLNLRAVVERYGEREAANFKELRYRFVAAYGVWVKIYKGLRCWLCQCAEGGMSETPLYKLMVEVSLRLAVMIVLRLPEYKEAEWE